MSKELKALERIKNAPTIYVGLASDIYTRYSFECNEIEKALKEYELMKQTKIIVFDKKISNDDLEKLKNQIIFASSLEEIKVELLFDEETQKKLKALEIIKEKGIILQFIKETYTVEQYNAGVFGTLVKPLSQEEYDLLKEIFDE